jgi:hypothetical protein
MFDIRQIIFVKVIKGLHFIPIKETYKMEQLTRLYVKEIVSVMIYSQINHKCVKHLISHGNDLSLKDMK